MAARHSRIEEMALELLPKSNPPSHLTAKQNLRHLWDIDCEWELRARTQALAVTGSPTAERDNTRVWWYVVESILRDCEMYDSPECPPRLPHGLVAMLRDTAGYLATGKIPQTIAAVQGRGTPSRGPEEWTQIEIAQAYAYLASSGAIADDTPIKTIAETYGIDRRTARKWVHEVGMRYEVTYDSSAAEIARMMRQAGAAYSKTGRSTTAISARGRSARK